jgi:hypothetical protein
MLTLIGSLLGFAGSAIPGVLEHFTRKEDNKKHLEIMKVQADLIKQNAEIDMQKFSMMAIDNEHARLIQHDIALQEDQGALAWLRKSVRPVITYLFFSLFAAVKVSTLYHGMEAGQDFYTAINLAWDEETQGIFAAIISFWFGSRAIEKRIR